jgi:hypothetical protein
LSPEAIGQHLFSHHANTLKFFSKRALRALGLKQHFAAALKSFRFFPHCSGFVQVVFHCIPVFVQDKNLEIQSIDRKFACINYHPNENKKQGRKSQKNDTDGNRNFR